MARTARSTSGRMILDSGAIIGWSRGDARVRALLREAISRNVELRVPVVVLAETLRGGPRDAPVNRVLKSTGTAPTEAAAGRRAGLVAVCGVDEAEMLVSARNVAEHDETRRPVAQIRVVLHAGRGGHRSPRCSGTSRYVACTGRYRSPI